MSNDSSSGGYLTPTDTLDEDAALDRDVESLIAGVTGLPGTLVWPQWQGVVATQPDITTNWCSFGIQSTTSANDVAFVHQPDADSGLGVDQMQCDEVLSILASFRGPGASAYARRFRDGLKVVQNLEGIKTKSMNLVDVSDIVAVPILINNNWQRRFDVPFRLRRRVVRTYPIRTITEAEGVVRRDGDTLSTFDTGVVT